MIQQVVSRIAAVALLMVALVTAAGYKLAYDRAERVQLSQLRTYVAERSLAESRLFRTANHELSAFQEEFLLLYENGAARWGDQFERYFRRHEDGSWRTRRRLFEGSVGAGGERFEHISGIVPRRAAPLDRDLKRKLVIGVRLLARFAPVSHPDLLMHATFPDNAIIVWSPGEPWGLEADPDLDILGSHVIKASLARSNPARTPVWTSMYYDSTAQDWALTYQFPTDHDGRHLVNVSHDIRLNQFLRDVVDRRLTGTRNMILSADGAVVAHPDKMEAARQARGALKLAELNDPALEEIYRRIDGQAPLSPGNVTILNAPKSEAFIAASKLDGPDWWWVTVYPTSLVAAKAHQTARLVLILGLILFAFTMIVVYWVIRRLVAKPIATMTQASERIGHGDYASVADGTWPLPEDQQNEIGLLARTVREMAGHLQDYAGSMENKIAERTRQLAEANEKLRKLSRRDALTGVRNRRAFDDDLQRLFNDAKEGQGTFALMLCDVDYFKPYNDTYGHEAGDQVLRTLAKALSAAARPQDRVYRYGGEELVILMDAADLTSAESQGARLLEAVRELALPHGESPHGIVTVSAGIAAFDPVFSEPSSILQAADLKMYMAKHDGRNRLSA